MNLKGAGVLGVGVDWAGSFHDMALGKPGQGVIAQFRIDYSPAGVQRLIARCLELEPDPAEVRVVLETRHGLLVEALADAGFTVLPVNRGLVARRRGPARKKDDAGDARICCLMALDACLELRRLIPHGEIGTELRAIARDDERAARDERRIGNRLRADLLSAFPAAIDIADGDLGAAVFLKLLQRSPSAGALAAASREELEAFPRQARHGWPARFAGQVIAAMTESRLAVRPELARRLACNRHLGTAVSQRAFCSLQQSAWAREFYDQKIAAGNNHHSALRKLGNRWLEILWHCLDKGVPYDETIHTANRQKTHVLKPAA